MNRTIGRLFPKVKVDDTPLKEIEVKKETKKKTKKSKEEAKED